VEVWRRCTRGEGDHFSTVEAARSEGAEGRPTSPYCRSRRRRSTRRSVWPCDGAGRGDRALVRGGALICSRTRHGAVHGGNLWSWHAPSGLPQARVPRHHGRGGRRGRLECDAPLVGGRRWWSAMSFQGAVRGGGQRNGASSWRRCTAVRICQRVFPSCDIHHGVFARSNRRRTHGVDGPGHLPSACRAAGSRSTTWGAAIAWPE
jgi:hypothetical protein